MTRRNTGMEGGLNPHAPFYRIFGERQRELEIYLSVNLQLSWQTYRLKRKKEKDCI